METQTKSKIQELQSREDLELLVEGDIIEVRFNGLDNKDKSLGYYEGQVVFVDDFVYNFIRRDKEKIMIYIFPKNIQNSLSIEDGRLVQTGRMLAIGEVSIGAEDYSFFDRTLKEAGL